MRGLLLSAEFADGLGMTAVVRRGDVVDGSARLRPQPGQALGDLCFSIARDSRPRPCGGALQRPRTMPAHSRHQPHPTPPRAVTAPRAALHPRTLRAWVRSAARVTPPTAGPSFNRNHRATVRPDVTARSATPGPSFVSRGDKSAMSLRA
jgi:hypothetical protein